MQAFANLCESVCSQLPLYLRVQVASLSAYLQSAAERKTNSMQSQGNQGCCPLFTLVWLSHYVQFTCQNCILNIMFYEPSGKSL